MSNRRCVAVAELAVHLAKLSGDSNAWKVADVASKLTSLEIRCQRFAERLCNEPISEDEQSRSLSSLRKRITQQISRLIPVGTDGRIVANGTALRFDVSGDPRGCCLKLYHPDLPKNGFGQDAYNVGA